MVEEFREQLTTGAPTNEDEAGLRHPLRQAAVDTLNRQLHSGISDRNPAKLVIALKNEDRLCVIHEKDERWDIGQLSYKKDIIMLPV